MPKTMNRDAHHRSSMAAIVLCGGTSRRMGNDKANVTLGNETLLQRSCRRISSACSPIVVVAAKSQELPRLPNNVAIVRDSMAEQGPLVAFESGLRWLIENFEVDAVPHVFLTSCDAPFVNLNIVAALHKSARDNSQTDVHVIKQSEMLQPFHGVYHRRVLPELEAFVAAGGRSFQQVLKHLQITIFCAEDFGNFDPDLQFLINVNSKDDLNNARKLLQRNPPE